MRNPFEYGGVVSGEAFCNREQELGDLLRAIENAEKLFVFSERRYGKTSPCLGAKPSPAGELHEYLHPTFSGAIVS